MNKKLISVLLILVSFLLISCKDKKESFANLRCIERENETSIEGYGYYFIGSNFIDSTCEEQCEETSQICYAVNTIPTENLVGNGGCHLFKGQPLEYI